MEWNQTVLLFEDDDICVGFISTTISGTFPLLISYLCDYPGSGSKSESSINAYCHYYNHTLAVIPLMTSVYSNRNYVPADLRKIKVKSINFCFPFRKNTPEREVFAQVSTCQDKWRQAGSGKPQNLS